MLFHSVEDIGSDRYRNEPMTPFNLIKLTRS